MAPGTGDQDGPDRDHELFRFNGFEFEGCPARASRSPWTRMANHGWCAVRRDRAHGGRRVAEAAGIGDRHLGGCRCGVWAIGSRDAWRPDVLRWMGCDWETVVGAAIRVAVSPAGEPWIVNDRGYIFRRLGGRWHRVQHGVIDIAFGADGNCWIAGIDGGKHGGNSVYRWNGRDWDKTDGAAIRIAVTPNGLPWLVNIRGGVYPRHLGR